MLTKDQQKNLKVGDYLWVCNLFKEPEEGVGRIRGVFHLDGHLVWFSPMSYRTIGSDDLRMPTDEEILLYKLTQ